MPPRSRIRDLSADPEVAGQQARDLCLRMLTDRARTRQELADALTAEGVPEPVIGGVLDRLEELGLLDDGAYADAFVRSRTRSGQARRVIERDLRTRGVSDQVAAEALEQVDGDHERATALRLASVRAGRTVGLPDPVRRRRLYGFLARRGYPSELVASVVEEALGATEATESVTG